MNSIAETIFQPVKELVVPIGTTISLAALGLLRAVGIQLQSNTQKRIWLQWVSSSILAFALTSLITSGPPGIFYLLFLFSAFLFTSTLQWQILKLWLFPRTWLGCGGMTAIGWIVGLWAGLELIPYYYDYFDFILGLQIGLTVAGAVAGIFQGYLLNKSSLKINLLLWTSVSALSMYMGSLIGAPFLFLPFVESSAYPSDFLFAVILGITYGTMTGAAILVCLNPAASRQAWGTPIFSYISSATHNIYSLSASVLQLLAKQLNVLLTRLTEMSNEQVKVDVSPIESQGLQGVSVRVADPEQQGDDIEIAKQPESDKIDLPTPDIYIQNIVELSSPTIFNDKDKE